MQAIIEKHSPLVLSVLLHAVLLLALWTTWSEAPRPTQITLPILMHVLPPPPPEPPAPSGNEPARGSVLQQTSPNPSEKQLSPVQRTSPDATEEEKPEVAVKIEKPEPPPTPEEKKPEEQPTPPQPVPTPAPTPTPGPTMQLPDNRQVATITLDDRTLEQFRANLQKTEAEQEARKSNVMSKLTTITEAEGGGPGVKRPYASAGSDRGTVREIDLTRYPKSVQERFMTRYRIKIQTRFVQGGSRQSYVNAVTTDDGTYLNSGGSGYYQVMTLSKEVLARMAQLEEQELIKRNLNPERSLVREVVFGLREDGNRQVDIYVARFRAEPIR